MKHLPAVALVALLLLLAACQLPPNVDIGKVVADTVAAVDKSGDGIVTNAELKSAKNDPMAWLTLIGGVLGTLGLGAGTLANRKSTAAQIAADMAASKAAEAKAESNARWDDELEKARAKVASLKAAAPAK